MREFPELYKQYFSKEAASKPSEPEALANQMRAVRLEPKKPKKQVEAMPEPKNYEDEEQGQEEADRELKDEADFEWEDEEERNDEWDEDDWDEFEVIERKDEF